MIQTIMDEISAGKRLEDVCKSVGIGWTTLYRFKADHKELADLIKATKSARYKGALKPRRAH